MKHPSGLGLCLLFGLASCITEDDDLTLDDEAGEASMRTAPSSGVGEYEVEPWQCAPTITAITRPELERGYQRYPGPLGMGAPGHAEFQIGGQNHVGSTMIMPDAGSHISFTAHSDSWNTLVSIIISSSTPLGWQDIILRNACGDSVGGGIQIVPVLAPQNVRVRFTDGGFGRVAVVTWSNPSHVVTHTRVQRRTTSGGTGDGIINWTLDGYAAGMVDEYVLPNRYYEYRVTNYSETDTSETARSGSYSSGGGYSSGELP